MSEIKDPVLNGQNEDIKQDVKPTETKVVEETKAEAKAAATLTQEQVNEIVQRRLAEEKKKAEKEKSEAIEAERKASLSETERVKEELAELKKEQAELKNQKKKDDFEKRMLAEGVNPEVSAQLLRSLPVEAMGEFDLSAFRSTVVTTIPPTKETKHEHKTMDEIMASFDKV